MAQRPINTARAEELYRFFGNWRLVGLQMAKEERRRSPYLGVSVQTAVYRARKQRMLQEVCECRS
jgi:hypothetical protein